jgi:hypothetical protein
LEFSSAKSMMKIEAAQPLFYLQLTAPFTLTDLSPRLLLHELVDSGAAAGTMHVETIRVILPTADSCAFPGEDVAALLACVEVLAVPQPRKKPLERVPHAQTLK